MDTDTTSVSETARAVLGAFNSHDTANMRTLWTDDVAERFPDGTVSGPAALTEYFDGLFTAVPDVRMDVISVAEDGDTAFVRWHLTGTHTGGGFQGLRPTGKRLEIDGFDQMTIRDGKLAANFVVFDRMQFGQQLGMLPPDGSAPERGMKAAFNAGTALKAKIAARR
ncbi:MAG: ester cyclase [Solirubrobacteraceae bacterium]